MKNRKLILTLIAITAICANLLALSTRAAGIDRSDFEDAFTREDISPIPGDSEKAWVELKISKIKQGLREHPDWVNSKIGADPLILQAAMWDDSYGAKLTSILLSAHADPNLDGEKGKTALLIAAGNGNVPIMKLLVEADANVAQKDEDGYTPIQNLSFRLDSILDSESRSFNDVKKALDLLIQHKASLNATREDDTALQIACETITSADKPRIAAEKLRVIGYMIKSGADANCLDGKKRTPLANAIRFDQNELVSTLLAAGASPNVPNSNGQTALHAAVKSGNKAIVKLLLDAGGDVTAKDNDGITPVVLAKTLDETAILKMLKQQIPSQEK